MDFQRFCEREKRNNNVVKVVVLKEVFSNGLEHEEKLKNDFRQKSKVWLKDQMDYRLKI